MKLHILSKIIDLVYWFFLTKPPTFYLFHYTIEIRDGGTDNQPELRCDEIGLQW